MNAFNIIVIYKHLYLHYRHMRFSCSNIDGAACSCQSAPNGSLEYIESALAFRTNNWPNCHSQDHPLILDYTITDTTCPPQLGLTSSGLLSLSPASLAPLTSLAHLDLSSNQLSRVPGALGSLAQLRTLADNSIAHIDPGIFSISLSHQWTQRELQSAGMLFVLELSESWIP